MNNDVVAIIPARSKSKSVIHKNLAPIGGFPLIAYSIAAAKMSSLISRVLVSTDSEDYAEIARSYGAEVPFLRPDEFSTDTSTDRDFALHAMNWLKENEGLVPEHWVHLRPTTPLRNPKLMDEAIDIFLNRADCTALRSAHASPESPFKWFRRNDEGIFTGLTSDETKLDRFNLPRQAYPTVYIPDGYVDIIRASFVMGTDGFHGDRVYAYESPFCNEVDSAEELELISIQVERHGSVVLDYLATQASKA